MPFTATVLTMFPEAFPGPLGVSLIVPANVEGYVRLMIFHLLPGPFKRDKSAAFARM